MHRARTAALSLAATAVAALTLGLAAGPAVAHGFGHNGFRFANQRHALTGVVQSVDPSANTAVIAFGGHQAFHGDWDHGSPAKSGTHQVTLDLSGAAIFDATAMHRECHSGVSASHSGMSASPTTLSTVQSGDVVTAVLAVSHSTARHDIDSGTAVPVTKLFDWGAPKSDTSAKGAHTRRFAHR